MSSVDSTLQDLVKPEFSRLNVARSSHTVLRNCGTFTSTIYLILLLDSSMQAPWKDQGKYFPVKWVHAAFPSTKISFRLTYNLMHKYCLSEFSLSLRTVSLCVCSCLCKYMYICRYLCTYVCVHVKTKEQRYPLFCLRQDLSLA